LTEKLFDYARRAVAEVVLPDNNARYLDICQTCRKRLITVGQGVTTKDKKAYLFRLESPGVASVAKVRKSPASKWFPSVGESVQTA
jgi:hypothetical protein